MPRQISWCFFPSLCHLLINTWSLSKWSDVQFHQLSTLRFQYSALHKQSPSICVCNNFKRKYGRKSFGIVRFCWLTIFVLGRRVSYQLTGYDVSKVNWYAVAIYLPRGLSQGSSFSNCYERRILLSVVAVVRYFSEWNECTGSGCGVYKWPAYWTGQSWPRIHRTNDGRSVWIEVQWSQTHENLPLAWLRYYSFKCPRPSRRQTN